MVGGFAYAQSPRVEKFKFDGFAWKVQALTAEQAKGMQSTGYVTHIDGVPCVVFIDAALRCWAQPVESVKGARYNVPKGADRG
jgi:hypothetical protein